MIRSTKILTTFIAVVSGCGTGMAPEDELATTHGAAMIGDDTTPEECDEFDEVGITCIKGKQGRSMLGMALPNVERLGMEPTSATWTGPDIATQPHIQDVAVDEFGINVQIDSGRRPDEEIAGLTFSNPFRAVRIVGSWPKDARNRSRYIVEHKLTASSEWEPLCPNNDYAYAIKGGFTAPTGDYGTPTELAFACRVSAAAKAIRWGYGEREGGGTAYLQAATRMARADYCGDGTSHTITDTEVLVYDNDGRAADGITDDSATPTPSPDSGVPFSFEAGWLGTRSIGALCLSKLRWQSLPPNGYCNHKLPDPRTRLQGTFCEDLGGFDTQPFPAFLTALQNAGAVTFTSSQYNEAGLWTWKSASGTENLTTTRGFWGGQAGGTTPPVAGYQMRSYVAKVFTTQRPDTNPLVLFYNATTQDYRTTTNWLLGFSWCVPGPSCPPNPWVWQEIVGYVYPNSSLVPAPLTAVGLRSWSKTDPSTGKTDHLLLPSSDTAPSGYVGGAIEGYGFIF